MRTVYAVLYEGDIATGTPDTWQLWTVKPDNTDDRVLECHALVNSQDADEAAFQKRIDDITEQRNELAKRIHEAKTGLVHLVEHWDEYSQGNLRNQITAIVEEVL